MTNFKSNEKVLLVKSNTEVEVRFHSFSRQRGFAFVTGVTDGKFKHVNINQICKQED
jgi:hypothetical protein